MEKNIYIKAYELLLSEQKIVLARTIKCSGSTPRDAGTMCIITQEEKLIGTIGGGLLEYRVQKQGLEVLKKEKSFIYQFHLTNEKLADAGMICGGRVDIYMEPLFYENKETVLLFKTIAKHIADNRAGILATKVENGIHALDTDARMFIKEDDKKTIFGIDQKKINLVTPCDLISFKDKNMDIFVEKIAGSPEVFIFGAGHVSMFAAQLAKMVGFRIIVIDDREKFASKKRFPDADNIIVIDFAKAFDQLNIRQNSYILIITRGHLYDKLILEKALGTKASYIGMIGSIRKRNIIYKDLMDKGFLKDDLEKVCSPVGIDINAQTPEEIAISIVGELIKKSKDL